MACNFKTTSAGTSIKRKVGANNARFVALVSLISNPETGGFTDEFVEYYQKVNHTDNIPSVDNSERGVIANTAIRYYNSIHFDVNAQSTGTYYAKDVDAFGYSDSHAKVYAITRAIPNIMRSMYVSDIRSGEIVDKDTILGDLIKRTKVRITKDIAANYLKAIGKPATNAEVNKIADALLNNNETYYKKDELMLAISKAFDKNGDVQVQNTFAIYKDIFKDTTGKDFFNRVIIADPIIGNLKYSDETESSLAEAYAEDFDSVDDSSYNNNEDEDVLTVGDRQDNTWNDHSGLGSSYMKGFDLDIRLNLSMIPKLTSNTVGTKTLKSGKVKDVYDYDKNNPTGNVDYIDVKDIISTLSAKKDVSNLNTFIDSVKEASNIPGMEGLIKLYKDLTSDLDYAARLYTQFKTVINKYETRIADENTAMNKSNKNSNAQQVHALSFLNDAKFTHINIDSDVTNKLVNEVDETIVEYTQALAAGDEFALDQAKLYNTIVDRIASRIKDYYPSADKASIDNYVRLANNGEVATNMRYLTDSLRKIAKASDATTSQYTENRDAISGINKEIRKLQTKIDALNEAGEHKGIDKINEEIDKLVSQRDNIRFSDYRSQDSITQSIALADKLYPYSSVKVELNSRNGLGNLQSDIINSSMITYLLKVLNSPKTTTDELGNIAPESLVNFAKFKFKNNQYNLSNILIETRENGKIVNYGLFYYDADKQKYGVTNYASGLLNVALFNGAVKTDEGTGITYAQMSKGDYVYTAFANYFNSDKNIDADRVTNSIPLANYFMRTPSDAPKTFVVRAPRYHISKSNPIRTVTNAADVDNYIKNYVAEHIASMSEAAFNQANPRARFIQLEDNRSDRAQITRDLTDNNITRSVYENEIIRNDGKTATIGYQFADEEGNVNKYIITGSIRPVKGMNKFVIENGKATILDNNEMRDNLRPMIYDKYRKQAYRNGRIGDVQVNYQVNREHPIYKQFRKIFNQELTNMAEAINMIFLTGDDGIIQREGDGKPKFNPNNAFRLDKESARRLYANYQTKKGKYLDSNYGLVGNMFHSDKFTITDYKTGKVRNYGQELLDDYFDSLYNGSKGGFIHFGYENGKIKLNHTKEQAEAIDNKMAEFISNYIDSSAIRMDEFKNLDVAGLINDDNVADFALNYRLAYNYFDDLFEGDDKFYKSSQDFLKRAKEGQASGTPYSTFNIYQDENMMLTDLKKMSYLNSQAIQDKLNSLGLHVTQRPAFVGITIKNTVRTSHEASQNGPVVHELARVYMKYDPELTEAEAIAKANKHMEGYQNTTVNDAQSYITFEEWIRRVAGRGQLNKYMPLIERIMDRSKPLRVDDIKTFVQVQKNFYYDMTYNDKINTYAPRQIKNAELVLVPRFIEGTDLEKVYNLMKDNGIDQLNTEETSKAGKAGVLTLFDEETGEVTDAHIQDFNNHVEDYKETYSYNFLYTQQETPQHMNAENKAAIQIMKKIVDNIPDTGTIGEVKKEFFKLYVANIKDSFNSLVKELNIPTNEDGSIKLDANGNIEGLDMKLFFNKLRKECLRQGLDSNILEFFTLNEDSPYTKLGRANTVMPTYMTNMMSKAQNVCQSMFNNAITRQKLPGFHAAQVTNVGYSKKLRYHPDGGRYIEVLLPKSNFGFAKNEDGTYTEPNEIRDEDGNLVGGLLYQLQRAKLDTIIGYRIPTEGKQSICAMKVVGFTDDAQGSTIVVPDDWVAQTGSDFDIDSVYGIQHNTYIDKDGDIQKVAYKESFGKLYDDYVKEQLNDEAKAKLEEAVKNGVNESTALANAAQEGGLLSREEFSKANSIEEKNSRQARNNRILDDMLRILQSDEAFEENTGQSQFEDIINARDNIMNDVVKSVRNGRSCYDFIDQAEYQEDVMSGAKLKAFSVTRDTFVSICNKVQPTIKDDYRITISYDKNKYDAKELIDRFGEDNVTTDYETEDYLVTHTTIGWTNDNKNVDGRILTAYSSETTAHILDAVKKGAVPNVNEFTFAVYKIFPDIGSNYKTGVAFMMHPAVTRIVNAYNKGKSVYSEDSAQPIVDALKEVAEELGVDTSSLYSGKMVVEAINDKLGTNYSFIKNNNIILDEKQLANDVKNANNVSLAREVEILMAYNDINRLADVIQKIVRVCNPDKFGAKQTIFATNEVFETIKDINNSKQAKVLSKNGIPFLESIYPGLIKDGVVDKDNYVKDTHESAYPSLNAFLKYASVTSTVVNSMLFETQNSAFVTTIKALSKMLPTPRRLTEKEYNDYEKYVIGAAYNNADGIRLGYTINSSTGRLESTKTSDLQERLRIYGFSGSPVFHFDVVDITEPTQDEIDAWSKLTPAQKVAWLQSKAEDAGIFGKLKVDLQDNYRVGNKECAAQSIRFNDDNVDTETAYNLFETATKSKNPLVKLAAIDLIKYAFVVEGFKMRRNGVNKIIKNSTLRDDTLFANQDGEPTSLLSQIDANFKHITYDDYRDDYLRSHSDNGMVPKRTVKKKRVGKIWVNELSTPNGVITLNVPSRRNDITESDINDEFAATRTVAEETEIRPVEDVVDNKPQVTQDKTVAPDDTKLAVKYGIYNVWTDRVNPYVKLTFKNRGVNTTNLYKTVRHGDIIFAYPVSMLEENEHGIVSVNQANNTLYSEMYYRTIIDNKLQGNQLTKEEADELRKEYANERAISSKGRVNTGFDINKDRTIGDIGGARDAYSKIINLIKNDAKGVQIINNSYLYNRVSKGFGNFQTIHDIINGNEVTKKIAFAKETKVIFDSEGKVIPYPVKVIQIIPSTNDKESTSVEYNFDMFTDINRRAHEGDVNAYREVQFMNNNGFENVSTDYTNMSPKLYEAIDRFTSATAKKLIGDADQFYKKEDGTYASIFAPETIEMIRNNPSEQRRFQKLLLDTDSLINKYGTIFDVVVDENENPEVIDFINHIKKTIGDLRNKLNLSTLNERFAREVVAKWSNDPNIQNGLIDICNGYHAVTWCDAWIGDLQDTGNSLIQNISKHIVDDISAKDMQAAKDAREFEKAIKALGHIDWDKLIDKNGKLIRDYNDKFVEDLDALNNKVNEARKDVINNPMAYLKAKHEYYAFKIAHLNQEFKDEYYKAMYDNDDYMLNTAPTIFAEYTKLREQIRNINRLRISGVLSPENEEEYRKLRRSINQLESTINFDDGTEKPIYNETNPIPGTKGFDEEGKPIIVDKAKYDEAVLNSQGAAMKLNQYLKRKRDINEEYNDTRVKDSFEEELDKRLDIIKRAEKRDAFGNKQVSDEVLANDEKYQRAKEWLEQNATWHVDPKISDEIAVAYGILSKGRVQKNNQITYKAKLIKIKLANGEKVYDSKGRIRGDIFTEEEQEAIRKDEAGRYNNTIYSAGNEQILINNAPEQKQALPAVVQRMLTSNSKEGKANVEYLKLVNEVNEILRPYYDTTKKEVNTITDRHQISIEELHKLADLYEKLRNTKKTIVNEDIPGNGSAVGNFIRKFMHTEYSPKFDIEYSKAKTIGGEYLKAWEDANMEYDFEYDEKGHIVKDSDGNYVYDKSVRLPNRFLYGTLTLKDEFYTSMKNQKVAKDLSKEAEIKTKALATINEYLETTTTPYYSDAMAEARAKGKEEFDKWFTRNHVWNVYTHKFDPIGIWQKTSIKPNYANGTWAANYNQLDIVPKEEYRNPDYKENTTQAENFKRGIDDEKYINNVILSDNEKQAKKLIETTLDKIVRDKASRRIISQGFIPITAKEADHDFKWFGKQIAEFAGWNANISSVGKNSLHADMSYSTDKTPVLPMIGREFTNKNSEDIDKIKAAEPTRDQYTTDEEYNKAMTEHKARLDAAEKNNKAIHQSLVNRDFISSISQFIRLAGHQNAVQDNKYLFYYGQNMIKATPVLDDNIGFSNLRKDINRSTSDVTHYAEKAYDERLYDQFTNWGNRLIYDRYKLPNNKLTKAANIAKLGNTQHTFFASINNAYGTASWLPTDGGNAFIVSDEGHTVTYKISTDGAVTKLSEFTLAKPTEYTLPAATKTTLGGVKAITNIVNVDTETATVTSLAGVVNTLLNQLRAAGIIQL
nr:MAG TPA: Head fiber protein [Crassvirales sp.]